jgi:hypothetical protein
VLFYELRKRSGAHVEDVNALNLQSINVGSEMVLDGLIRIESLGKDRSE